MLSVDNVAGDASPEKRVQAASAKLVVVPTRASARQLRLTIDHDHDVSGGAGARLLPDFVTRDQLYDRLESRLSEHPRRLTPIEREVIIHAAAIESIAAGVAPSFRLRPRLVAEIVRFYDQLRRQGQTIARFEEMLAESLGRDIDLDRGAERMLQQTRFLGNVYRVYEQRLSELSSVDEHTLRDHLIRTSAGDPVKHVVVTVADWIADANGLYRADFDLLTRLPALETIEIIATDELLASGFHQRIHEWMPGIEEIDQRAVGVSAGWTKPILTAPSGSAKPVFVVRDRKDELVAVLRRVRDAHLPQSGLERTAIVFKHPLPYLYVARDVFRSARVPYQTFDSLPLAAEPLAAALDLVLEFVTSQFARSATIALLRSPHFDFGFDDQPLLRSATAILDRALSASGYLGELERLRALADEWTGDAGAGRALRAAVDAAGSLQRLLERAPASVQLTRLASFLTSYGRTAAGDERNGRAKAAVLEILSSLATAHTAYDDPETTIEELAPDIRRWIEEGTFSPECDESGLQLLDAQAARYGDFDDLFIVGMIDGEWPERPKPSIFYPVGVLAGLGWPSERERRGAASAAFVDLARSAYQRVTVSTFTLEDEALVQASSFLDELGRTGLPIVEAGLPSQDHVLSDEGLSLEPPAIDMLDERALSWVALRQSRTDASDPRFHGQTTHERSRPLSVSAIETYLTCPFKFFARYVLRLEEEREADEVMDPKKQGRFVHAVFHRFFAAWQARGHGAITSDKLHAARELFSQIVEEQVAHLPEAEVALERTRLLGSPVAEGLGEIVFRMEAERPVDVVDRLLEYPLEGEFELAGPDGPRRVALRGVADRLDLLADGTIRLIDYKLSSAPQRSRALQLPIYGVCAEQRLQRYHGQSWTLGEAAYIAFRGPKRIVPLFTARSDRDDVLGAAQLKLVQAVDRIERGEFPPTPEDAFLCGFCSYSTICRKDYVGDV